MYVHHGVRKVSVEFHYFSARRDVADEDLLNVDEENVPERNESFLLRPGGRGRNFSCLCECPRLPRYSCSQKSFSLGKGVVPSARTAERTPTLSNLRGSRRLKYCASIWPSLLNLGLALRTSPHTKRHESNFYEGCKVMTPVLGFRNARVER